MNLTILPADTYYVVDKSFLNEENRKVLTLLYQPIIGYSAISLYFTLLDQLNHNKQKSEECTHYNLMNTLQLKLNDILIAREKLEAIGLLKTYIKEENINNYIYFVYAPISVNEFFNHPILNVVLYNNIGKYEYEKRVELFKKVRIDTKDYKEVTSTFKDIFGSKAGNFILENEEIKEKETSKIVLNEVIDFNQLISSISKDMIADSCFNKDTRELINSLAFIYNLDNNDFEGLIKNSINEKGLIDKTNLRKSCRNYYQFEENNKLPTLVYRKQPEYLKNPNGDSSKWAKLVYTFENLTPYEYLKSMHGGTEPTARDLKLIEDLLIDMKLNPGVVNVLISYVLKINNQKLNKAYLETIAGQWKRLKVETVEEAMRVSEKEHKKIKKNIEKKNTTTTSYQYKKKEEKLPEWFDKELSNKVMNEEEQNELEQLLNSV